MNSKEKKPVMTEEDIMKLLDSCYEKCLNEYQKLVPVLRNWLMII